MRHLWEIKSFSLINSVCTFPDEYFPNSCISFYATNVTLENYVVS